MKIISDIKKDVRNPHKVPGSYEWWYFDAVSDNGYSVVIIFYDGNPFSRRYIQSLESNGRLSPSDYPAITISVYKDGVPLFYSFEETEPDQAEFSADKPHGRVGANSFSLKCQSNNRLIYHLQLNQKLPNGESLSASLEMSFRPVSSLNGQLKSHSSTGSSGHEWNLVVPRGNVSGSLHLNGTGYDFNGTGYHDHNSGDVPMKESYAEWYWGRYHMEEETLIYYMMHGESGWKNKAWILDADGALLTDRLTCHPEDEEFNLFGLLSARKIIFRSDSGEWLVQKNRLIDNGPFYQRFEGRLSGRHDGKLIRGHGFSEYIKPSRIYSKIFWPLVDMRIKYPGEPHWVQKSRRLHRWTWQRL